MKICKGQTYKLIEMPHGFVLGPAATEVPHPAAQNLVIADRADLVNYFSRYLEAREAGLNISEAHDAAVKDAVPRVPH